MHCGDAHPHTGLNDIHLKVIFAPRLPQLRIVALKLREIDFRQFAEPMRKFQTNMGLRGKWQGMDRARDRDMGMGIYMPKPTILVAHVDAVPCWAIGVGGGDRVCYDRPD
jgi:hypothetical protein